MRLPPFPWEGWAGSRRKAPSPPARCATEKIHPQHQKRLRSPSGRTRDDAANEMSLRQTRCGGGSTSSPRRIGSTARSSPQNRDTDKPPPTAGACLCPMCDEGLVRRWQCLRFLLHHLHFVHHQDPFPRLGAKDLDAGCIFRVTPTQGDQGLLRYTLA